MEGKSYATAPTGQSLTVRRIRLIVFMFLLNIIASLFLLHLQDTVSSGVRAFIRGEGLWGKAQKQAHIQLSNYAWSRDEAYYNDYLKQLRVPLGDHKLRLALQLPHPDRPVALEGFIEGNNDPLDFDDLATVFRWFKKESHVANAIAVWTEADQQIEHYRQLATVLHQEINRENPRVGEIQRIMSQLDLLNNRLTDLEFRFSVSQSDAARFAAKMGWWGSLVVMASLLGATLIIAWRITRSIEQTEQALLDSEGRFRRLSQQDSLTGLPNRFMLHELLLHSIQHAKRYKKGLALLFLDLDNFKAINDNHGHRAGDELLKQVGLRLKNAIRAADTVARLGGDEFVILLDEISHRRNATQVAEVILHTFQSPFQLSAGEVNVGVSIGIACYPEDGEDIETLTESADAAMYHVKYNGKNSYSHPAIATAEA